MESSVRVIVSTPSRSTPPPQPTRSEPAHEFELVRTPEPHHLAGWALDRESCPQCNAPIGVWCTGDDIDAIRGRLTAKAARLADIGSVMDPVHPKTVLHAQAHRGRARAAGHRGVPVSDRDRHRHADVSGYGLPLAQGRHAAERSRG